MLRETDALLVWGGDVLYLRHWMQASGLADLLPSLTETVYVGVSAGSIVLTPYNCDAEFDLQFVPEGSDMGEGAGAGLGLVDFALRVHLDSEGFDDSTTAEVEKWAAGIPAPTYAIDDEIVELEEWDAVRVPPGTWRGYEAGPDGLEILVIGAPSLGDAPRDDVDGQRDWW